MRRLFSVDAREWILDLYMRARATAAAIALRSDDPRCFERLLREHQVGSNRKIQHVRPTSIDLELELSAAHKQR